MEQVLLSIERVVIVTRPLWRLAAHRLKAFKGTFKDGVNTIHAHAHARNLAEASEKGCTASRVFERARAEQAKKGEYGSGQNERSPGSEEYEASEAHLRGAFRPLVERCQQRVRGRKVAQTRFRLRAPR